MRKCWVYRERGERPELHSDAEYHAVSTSRNYYCCCCCTRPDRTMSVAVPQFDNAYSAAHCWGYDGQELRPNEYFDHVVAMLKKGRCITPTTRLPWFPMPVMRYRTYIQIWQTATQSYTYVDLPTILRKKQGGESILSYLVAGLEATGVKFNRDTNGFKRLENYFNDFCAWACTRLYFKEGMMCTAMRGRYETFVDPFARGESIVEAMSNMMLHGFIKASTLKSELEQKLVAVEPLIANEWLPWKDVAFCMNNKLYVSRSDLVMPVLFDSYLHNTSERANTMLLCPEMTPQALIDDVFNAWAHIAEKLVYALPPSTLTLWGMRHTEASWQSKIRFQVNTNIKYFDRTDVVDEKYVDDEPELEEPSTPPIEEVVGQAEFDRVCALNNINIYTIQEEDAAEAINQLSL